VHDGTNGVTECPIPPKASKVYTFRATQYGTSWYHRCDISHLIFRKSIILTFSNLSSHFSAQYGNGVVGTIQINGPASLPYDIDLGVFPISDYYYRTADELVAFTKSNGAPPSDNILINGTAIHPVTGFGTRANVTLTKGKRHRLRLINTSVENHFQVSLVNHTFTVIAADLVPVNAYTTSNLFLAVGQRYDVTIDASAAVGNYWFNVSLPNALCGTTVPGNQPAAIFHYAGAPGGNPTIQGTPSPDTMCFDTIDLVPIVSRTASPGSFNPNPGNTLPVHLDTIGSPLFVWKVNGSAIDVDWNKPTLQYVLDGNTSYPTNANVISVNSVNQWTYWLIENDPDGVFSLPHPFHLHGHDFLVLGRSPVVNPGAQRRFKFDPATDLAGLKGNNPVRRDVTMLPAKGWLLIAFTTDNPGAWLMHCHIAWHVSGGLSVQFVERAAELRAGLSAADKAVFNNNCAAWRRYFPSQDPFPKSDSGI
jgi:FtsP/CotA-like multicopper oxidase with cupredoxin domain